jgi:hypothetical protein
MANYIVTYSAQNGTGTASGRTFLDGANLDTVDGIKSAEAVVLENLRKDLPGAHSLFLTWFHPLKPAVSRTDTSEAQP